jgi:cytochrome oxidase Cu insertion factor (SCO1/SenC/PrrC family)
MKRIAGPIVVALTAGGVLALVVGLPGCKDSKSGDQTASTVQSTRPPNLRPKGPSAPPAAGPKVGQPAPDIDGTDQDGKSFKLSDYKGKVVLLDFWGNW